MSKTIKQIAEEIGVSKTAVRKQIINLGLQSSLQKNANRFAIEKKEEMLIRTVFDEKSETKIGNQTETKTQTANHEVCDSVDGEIRFLRSQVEKLQTELEKEREHNREKDKQLLDVLNKLAESQAALSAGQAADKQKALAEKIIEGKQQLDENEETKKVSFLSKFFKR